MFYLYSFSHAHTRVQEREPQSYDEATAVRCPLFLKSQADTPLELPCVRPLGHLDDCAVGPTGELMLFWHPKHEQRHGRMNKVDECLFCPGTFIVNSDQLWEF